MVISASKVRQFPFSKTMPFIPITVIPNRLSSTAIIPIISLAVRKSATFRQIMESLLFAILENKLVVSTTSITLTLRRMPS